MYQRRNVKGAALSHTPTPACKAQGKDEMPFKFESLISFHLQDVNTDGLICDPFFFLGPVDVYKKNNGLMVNDVILDVEHCHVSSCEDECIVLDLLSGPIGTQVQHRCPFPHIPRTPLASASSLHIFGLLSLSLSPSYLSLTTHTHTHTQHIHSRKVRHIIVESAQTQTCQHRLHRSRLWACPPPTSFPYG